MAKRPVSKFRNDSPVSDFLRDAQKSGKVTEEDATHAGHEFEDNWIETVIDLRQLHKDALIAQLDVCDLLKEWIIKQCGLDFEEHAPTIKTFRFEKHFDENGILFWLGTGGGKKKPWTNPMLLKEVLVTSSSLMHDSQPAFALVGRSAVRCVTKPADNSWYQVDFLKYKVKPTHYMLRHYISWDSEAARHWHLEASNDNKDWVVLKKHENDESLDAKGKCFTWPLHANEFFQRFRIRQTGLNSNRHNYLALSGFEIYGDLMLDHQSQSSSRDQQVFTFTKNFDDQGIVYWLGTGKGQHSYSFQNPALAGYIKIYRSSLSADSDKVECLVDRELKRVVTEPKKMSWYCIDFKDIEIQPSHYMLRHYSSFDTEAIRNWRFEGSNDSTNGHDGLWTTIMVHKNDKSLDQKGQCYTWPINPPCKTAFSKFRILQNGVNSNQHHYLALSAFEIYGTITKSGPARAPKAAARQPAARHDYAYDFDENGVLYWLGTHGRSKEWANPMEQKLVVVTSSTIMNNSQPMSAVVGRRSVRCVTKPHAKSWIAVNFLNNQVKPTAYTLRHYQSWDTEALRYWNFEGSTDGRDWRVISKHTNDTALSKAGQAHTWRVDCDRAYTHFRIYMTNRNSNDHWYLSLSGFEIYGDAFGPSFGPNPTFRSMDPNKKAVAQGGGGNQREARRNANAGGPADLPNGGKRFQFSYHLDENGLCYFLGTNFLTATYQNPASRGHIGLKTSALMDNSAPLISVVGRDMERCVTKPIKNAWVSIQFFNFAIRPTHYTLRHYSSWDTEALRNWRFEGSCDGERWNTIREHVKDQSLNKKGQAFTWEVKCAYTYSYFRVLQFDKNSNQHLYLALSGFEVYGDVYHISSLGWSTQAKHKSKYLEVNKAANWVEDACASENCPWQTILSEGPLQFSRDNKAEFSLLVERAPKTNNSWKFLIGVAPESFECHGSKQWLGSQSSWAYIGGTGGKCYNVGKSESYGDKWGERPGDLVTCVVNRGAGRGANGTIEFFLNGRSQGVAFKNVPRDRSALHAAASLTAYGARVRLVDRVWKEKRPDLVNVAGRGKSRVGSGIGKWDPDFKSPKLKIHNDGVTVTNIGSENTWQCVVGRQEYSRGRCRFAIEITKDAKTTNTWRFIIGVVPLSFKPQETSWLGSQNSWGYIAGTGGKCHNQGKSEEYGEKYGNHDTIIVEMDFDKHTLAFHKNKTTQAVAFRDLHGPVKAAISFCGTNSAVRLKTMS